MIPTKEQEQAMKLFQEGRTFRIEAYAGTGKTSTLEMLGRNSGARKGLYIAFNTSIVGKAKSKFPKNVECRTTHSLAWRTVRSHGDYSNEKLRHSMNGPAIADFLDLKEDPIRLPQFTVSRVSFANLIGRSCKQFMLSIDEKPERTHILRTGRLEWLADSDFDEFCEMTLVYVRRLWQGMIDPHTKAMLGHDGYLKLWSLRCPTISNDFILLDEAQDTNAAVLSVLKCQTCQVVYVGDPYQQIYEWRGAINAMEKMHTEDVSYLTKSFRFGEGIASGATKVLRKLGAPKELTGHDTKVSHIGPVEPVAILCRTNAGLFSWLPFGIGYGPCHIVGGTSELERLLDDVRRLKKGVAAISPEFFGFSSWKELVLYVEQEGDQQLRTFVKLVEVNGEEQLLEWLKQTTETEEEARIVLSTAHKAKGREWPTVLVADDFASAFDRCVEIGSQGLRIKNEEQFKAEARLFYVAMTRGLDGVELPKIPMLYFGITPTTQTTVRPVGMGVIPPVTHTQEEPYIDPTSE